MTEVTANSDEESPEAREKREAQIQESVLLDRARLGDLEAYEELMRNIQPRIYSLLYNMCSHKEDAEDLLQEVFLKAWQSLPKFQGKSSFYTWVYRIAVNRAINFVKKRKRRQGYSLDDVDLGMERDPALVEMAGTQTPLRDSYLKELQEKLNTALQTLSEKHRSVVIMHDIQGMPHHEIAEILNVSPGTVRSRLFYARQLLQPLLSDLRKSPDET